MAGSNYTWDAEFLALFDRCMAQYRAGNRDFTRYYSGDDSAFLAAIGCKPREFFDFVEDHADGGDPTPATALLVAAVRRDFFLTIQKGRASPRQLNADDLPPKDDNSLGGIPWLARIVAKARAKLHGELHPDIMYGCGGDRAFLERHNVHPADFLRALWAAGDDDSKLLEWLRGRQG